MEKASTDGQCLGAGKASNVRVIARVRPLAGVQRSDCVACLSDNTLEASQDGSSLHFMFDKVHGIPDGAPNSQADIFSDVQDIVLSALQGLSGCIMAYGQTGSGKTHTLVGDLDSAADLGLLARAVNELAEGISSITDGSKFHLDISVVEIYCESIKDLLCSDPGRATGSLSVQQDREHRIIIAGATRVAVANEGELAALSQQGLSRRTVASTCMNAGSSRSHCLITLTVQRHLPDGAVMHGKLTLVDLAGSERQDKAMAVGLTFEEGKLINKSLSALGNVVNALADNPAGHIPYRDSKLTRALQDTLGGNARMALVVCCSPAAADAAETISSLRFGARAKGIVTSLQKPSVRKAAQIEAHRQLATALQANQELRDEVLKLKEALAAVAMLPQMPAETEEEHMMRVDERAAPGEAFPLRWQLIAQVVFDIVIVIIPAIYMQMWAYQCL